MKPNKSCIKETELPTRDVVLKRLWAVVRRPNPKTTMAVIMGCKAILEELGGKNTNKSQVKFEHSFEQMTDKEIEAKKKELIKSLTSK